jgi:hypothetical protein
MNNESRRASLASSYEESIHFLPSSHPQFFAVVSLINVKHFYACKAYKPPQFLNGLRSLDASAQLAL